VTTYHTSLLACLGLCVLIFSGGIAGYRLGRRRRLQSGEELVTGTVDAAVLSLLGLLIAFTFSNAYSRYEARRGLIVDEANAIGTAILRLDLLPPEARREARSIFREYVHSRYHLWELFPNHAATMQEYRKSQELQNRIWSFAVRATESETHGDARKLLLPALNDMIDITTTRLVVIQSHPPLVIFLLLSLLTIAAAMLIGFGMAGSQRLSYFHLGGFAVVMGLSLLLILDIEYPRHGYVRLDQEHLLLRELEESLR
jgi:ABC-type multidrug transport system fused ATPase/permease subunit